MHITTVPQSLIFLEGQAQFIKNHGYEPVFVSSPSERLVKFGEAENCTVYGVPLARKIAPIADVRSIRKLVALMKELRPSIVHAHTPKGGLIGMLASRIAGIEARVYHIHGFPFMAMSGTSRLLMQLTERTSSFLANRVLCVSPSIREVAIQNRIVPTSKVKVLANGTANGVDAVDRFNPRNITAESKARLRQKLNLLPDDEVVTFVGRLAVQKGLNELLEAWKEVSKHRSNAKLVLLGDLDERDPVSSEWLQTAQGMESVILAGFHDKTELFYAISALVVLPTYREGFPTVLLEAAAMELPSIATSIPGCVDAIVDGQTGVLVPARDPKKLAHSIVALLGDEETRIRMGRAGRTRVLANFKQEDLLNMLVAEYDRLIGDEAG